MLFKKFIILVKYIDNIFYTFRWQSSQVTVKSSDKWQAVFEGVIGNGNSGNIAIDDIRIAKGDCPNKASCDFEHQNLCDYTNTPTNKINWVVADIMGLFTSGFEGPTLDHTFGTNKGKYAIFNTANTIANWTGRIESEIIQGSSYPKCFKFYYHMFSTIATRVGSLNVYVKSVLMNEEELVWSLTGSQDKRNQWLEGRFNIARSEQYTLIIEGVSTGGRGDISVDDLNLFESTFCNTEPYEANVYVPTTTAPTTTSTAPLSTFSWVSNSHFDCNFEDGVCSGWKNDPTNDPGFDWIRNRNSQFANSG